MTVLSPTSLETIDYGQQGWSSIFNSDMQRINAYFNTFSPLWHPAATPADGAVLTYNAASKKWVATADKGLSANDFTDDDKAKLDSLKVKSISVNSVPVAPDTNGNVDLAISGGGSGGGGVGWDLFDIKLTDRLLTGSSAIGWLLCGGRTLAGHATANQAIAAAYDGGTAKVYILDTTTNFINSGAVVNASYIATGFSEANYIAPTKNLADYLDSGDEWEIKVKFVTGSNITAAQGIAGGTAGLDFAGIDIRLTSGRLKIFLSSNGSFWDISGQGGGTGTTTLATHTTYWLKLSRTATQYILSLSADGATYTDQVVYTNSSQIYLGANFALGFGNNLYLGGSQPFLGGIDLNETEVTVNGGPFWQAIVNLSIPYRQSGKRNIVLADQKPAIDALFNTTGLASFYIINDDGTLYLPRNAPYMDIESSPTDDGLYRYYYVGTE